jgi:hypothetical protein
MATSCSDPRAVALGAKLFDRALEVLRPGVKEVDVAG